MSASLVGRLGSSAFRLSTNSSVDVARGLSLLFGHGTKALPSWDSKTRWNNLSVGLAIGLAPGPSGHTNSPHPSSREGHHSTTWWSSSFLPVVIGFTSASCCCSFSGPSELGAISPDAVHDDGQPSRQRDNRSFHPAPSGNLHRPGLEPRPFCRT